MKKINKILIIRFRQMGDAILTTALCSTMKRSFPDAEIHLVLNAGLVPALEGHPDIDRIIPFRKEDNKPFGAYLKKVWKVVHDERYDVIVDMRATVRTLLFSLFSLHTPYRIGRKKGYAGFLLNHQVDVYDKKLKGDMVQRNLLYATFLEKEAPIQYTKDFKLYLKKGEKEEFRRYMEQEGIDFTRPVMLVGVTTKLPHKKWEEGMMKQVIQRILERYKNLQLIFNYAPGAEEADARRMFEALGRPTAVKIEVQARSLRQLMALCSNCSFYFGNEGGARHMVQALGIPSYSIYSPKVNKSIWLPSNEVLAEGICPNDVQPSNETEGMDYWEHFGLITPKVVCSKLFPLLDNYLS